MECFVAGIWINMERRSPIAGGLNISAKAENSPMELISPRGCWLAYSRVHFVATLTAGMYRQHGNVCSQLVQLFRAVHHRC